MIHILSAIDIQPLLDCYHKIEDQICWTDYGHKGRQASVQQKPGEEPWTNGVGRSQGDDLSFTELNPAIKGTPFETAIKQFGLTRTRLMWVGPFACYSMHRDITPRVHIPLITNADCYFVFKHKRPKHLAPGSVYYVDTRLDHTFMNCSDSARLHLIGAVRPGSLEHLPDYFTGFF